MRASAIGAGYGGDQVSSFARGKKLAVLAVTTPLSVFAVPERGHAAAPASAPNDVIAYSVLHNVSTTSEAVTNADGSDQHAVTAPGVCYDRGVAEVVYSPDGRRAAFMCDAGTGIVYVANADLAKPVPIYTANGSVDGMAWAPDGSTVYISVFQNQVGAPGSGTTTTVAARTDGSGASPVPGANSAVTSVGPDGTLCLGPGVALLHPGSTTPQVIAQGEDGVLSPDGTRVAYKNFLDGPANGGPAIIVHALDGGAADVSIPIPAGGLFTAMTWSPDSSQIAFSVQSNTADMRDRGSQLWTVQAGPTMYGEATKLVDLPPANIIAAPSWHSGPIPTTPRGAVVRLAGPDRVATSVAVADAGYGPGRAQAKSAVLSRDDNFADALAGNALAAEKGGPLMLTGSGRLDPRVAGELKRILAPGATVYVLGGTGALSSQIDSAIRGLGLVPHRVAGADRYDTATRIAAEISPHPRSVLVATGQNFPDALAAGAAAANDPQGGVVVLTDGASMPAETKAYLKGLNVSQTRFYGVGGQAVTALGSVTGMAGHFTPLSGSDRYATDLAVANNAALFPAPATAGIATALNWPDALSGGAFVGAQHAPLLLIDNTGSESDWPNASVDAWLSRHAVVFGALTVFGGPSVVQPAIEQAAGDAVFGPGGWDAR